MRCSTRATWTGLRCGSGYCERWGSCRGRSLSRARRFTDRFASAVPFLAAPGVDRGKCRAANVVIEQYGEDAQIHSTKRASAMLDKGDLDAYAVWKRILRAVGELQGTEPKSGEAVH